ncbi:hypothetical protein SDC9_197385 [bioreactor metagenome]|uniref:Uncharacterized protein n=1 Tax=bioreactor metagenome TaxID=1076179 RepID=A0A645IR63_9ZZZZ
MLSVLPDNCLVISLYSLVACESCAVVLASFSLGSLAELINTVSAAIDPIATPTGPVTMVIATPNARAAAVAD